MGLPSLLPHSPQRWVYPACYPTHPNERGSTQPATPLTPTREGLPSLLPHSPQRWVYPACYPTHPNDGSTQPATPLTPTREGLPSLLPHSPQRWASGRSCRPWQTWSGSISHRRCSLPRRRTWCSAAASADKVLRVPAPTHGCRIWTPGGGEERRGMRVRRGGIKERERECTWQLYRATTEEVP